MKEPIEDEVQESAENANSNWLGERPVRPSGHEIHHQLDNSLGAPCGLPSGHEIHHQLDNRQGNYHVCTVEEPELQEAGVERSR